MNKLRRISVIFMSLLMLFAMTISVSAATKVQDGIEVTLNTNLQSYDKGEEIVTAITVKNTNSYAVTDVDISCVVPAGYALAKNVGVSTIPVLGANETKTLTVELEAVSGTATGDSSNMTLWGVLLVLALAGAVTLGIVYRKRWTRTLSLILCMAIVVSLLPANTMQISAATGSESAPYLVTVEAEKCWYDSSVYIEINEEYFSDSYTGSKVSLHEKHETAEKALENVSGDGA
ncbi:MAG: hypothetical protein IKA09_10480, partial [Lachnospiraceae bacterium]|nr:hypothetical protein [Lachnospiraceae bacterium]